VPLFEQELQKYLNISCLPRVQAKVLHEMGSSVPDEHGVSALGREIVSWRDSKPGGVRVELADASPLGAKPD
jgi:hypothetical protein